MSHSKVKISVVGAAVIALGATGTMALFSDTATTSIQVTSATFGIEVNGSSTGTYSVVIDSENLAPGETRTGDITLVNTSTVPARIDLMRSGLTEFTSAVTNDDGTPFSVATIPAGATLPLDLSIGLPSSVTESPASETLVLLFNADQA